jgi:acyl-ACP thioesterase
MAIPRRIEQAYRVRFDESGPDGRLRGSGFLRYAQDLAWVHSESAGFGREWYAERRLTWLIRAVELELLDAVPYGRTLDVSTEVLGLRRVWARRRSEFDPHGGERTVALATIDWVLLGERGTPVRVPAEILGAFDGGHDATFTPLRVSLGQSPDGATARQFDVRRGELDPMNHVNNAAHLDYIDEHLAAIGRSSTLRQVPRRYTVEFVAPAEHGASLVGRAWEEHGGWSYRLDDGDGRELVRARVETDLSTWVGG